MGKNDRDDSMSAFQLLPGPGWVGGVCAAIAYRLSMPTWLVRLIAVLLMSGKGFGLLPYLLLWWLVPNAKETPSHYAARTGDTKD